MGYKTKMATASATAALALTTMAIPAQALVSDTNAEANDTTNAITHIQLSDKAELDAVQANGSGIVHVTSCTGTLIAPQWILSAAHCVKEGLDKYSGVATFGTTDDGQEYKIDDVKMHSDQDDMALFHLDKPVRNITPLKLWDSVIQEEKQGQAYGWGKPIDEPRLKALNTLNGTMLPEAVHGGPFKDMDTNEVIFDGGHSAKGDSGSPFIIDDTVYGVLSMATIPDKGEISHGLYMPVAQYKEWIEKTIEQNDSFVTASGEDSGNAQPQEDGGTVDAEVPTKEDTSNGDTPSEDESSQPSTSQTAKPSTSHKSSTNKGTQVDDSRVTDATVINPPEDTDEAVVVGNGTVPGVTTTGNTAAGNTAAGSTTTGSATAGNTTEGGSTVDSTEDRNSVNDSAEEEAVGPTVKTGGKVQGKSFFAKVKQLF